jgi:hypothetical protein
MAVPGLCSVTVQVTALAGIPLPAPITLFEDVTFPKVNGIATIEVLGVTLQIPCPSVDLELDITVNGTLVSLLINADQIA